MENGRWKWQKNPMFLPYPICHFPSGRLISAACQAPKAMCPEPEFSPPFALDSARLLEAQQLIAKHLRETRLVPSRALARGQTAVYLKLECELPTGSFKVRGALYAT